MAACCLKTRLWEPFGLTFLRACTAMRQILNKHAPVVRSDREEPLLGYGLKYHYLQSLHGQSAALSFHGSKEEGGMNGTQEDRGEQDSRCRQFLHDDELALEASWPCARDLPDGEGHTHSHA